MTETMGVAEAKQRFSELIDRVLAGERFVVTRRGRPVIALTPPTADVLEMTAERPKGGLLALAGFLDGVMTDEEVDQMVAEIYADRRKSKSRDVPAEWFE